MRPAEMTDDVTGEWLDRAVPPVAITLSVAIPPEGMRRSVVVDMPAPGLSPLLNFVGSLKRPVIEVTPETFARLSQGDHAILIEAFACVRAQRIEEAMPGDPQALTRAEAVAALACGRGEGSTWHCVLDVEEVDRLTAYVAVIDAVAKASADAAAAREASAKSAVPVTPETPNGPVDG